jgi:hypothetical protein
VRARTAPPCTPRPPLTRAADHLFVGFLGTNRLALEQMNPVVDLPRLLRDYVLPQWKHGYEPSDPRDTHFAVRLARSPWGSQGPDAIMCVRGRGAARGG